MFFCAPILTLYYRWFSIELAFPTQYVGSACVCVHTAVYTCTAGGSSTAQHRTHMQQLSQHAQHLEEANHINAPPNKNACPQASMHARVKTIDVMYQLATIVARPA